MKGRQRVLVVTAATLAAMNGCNAILGNEERQLAIDDGGSAREQDGSRRDALADISVDVAPDSGRPESDASIDVRLDVDDSGGRTCASTCATSQYCNVGTGQCSPCGDVSRLHFGAPKLISPVRSEDTWSERFPRLTSKPNEMVFRGDNGPVQMVYLKSSWDNPATAKPVDAVNFPNENSSGPLEVAGADAGTSILYFDFTQGDAGVLRKLATKYGSSVYLMPSGFNVASSNYSIAVAEKAGRAWWMAVGASSELVTSRISGNEVTAVRPTIGSIPCERSGSDSTPWATADGSMLLFSSLEVGQDCSRSGTSRDLFVAAMDTDGQPAAPAIALDVNQSAADDTDPSLSADYCWLFFASNRAGPPNTYRVYRAARQ